MFVNTHGLTEDHHPVDALAGREAPPVRAHLVGVVLAQVVQQQGLRRWRRTGVPHELILPTRLTGCFCRAGRR
jgi:hypothetical protein